MIFHKAKTIRCTSVHTIFHVLTHFLRCAFSHSFNSSTINSQRGTLYVCATKIPVATPKTNDQKRIYIIYSYIYSHRYIPLFLPYLPRRFVVDLFCVSSFSSFSFRRFSRFSVSLLFFSPRGTDGIVLAVLSSSDELEYISNTSLLDGARRRLCFLRRFFALLLLLF